MHFQKLAAVMISIAAMQCGSTQGTPTVPAAVDCALGSLQGLLQLSSPQFAVLCQIAGNLTADNNIAAPLVGLTADMICDGDCRFVMGATSRGGRCGQRSSDNKTYCICDYGTEPIPPIFPTFIPNTVFATIENTVCKPDVPWGNITFPIFSTKACNSDCQCSHGYGNTGNHKCTTQNGQPGNASTTYACVCENATNLP